MFQFGYLLILLAALPLGRTFMSEGWAGALSGHGGDPSGWHSPAWSSDSSLAFIDAQRIATAASRGRVTYSPKYTERCSGASSHHIRCLP
jgi:hypothetical protein